jgi:hypothetical protein
MRGLRLNKPPPWRPDPGYSSDDYDDDGELTPEARERHMSQDERERYYAAEAYRERINIIKARAEVKIIEAAGDKAALDAVDQWFNDALERAEKQYEQRRNMPTHEDAFTAAQAALNTGLVSITAALKSVEERAATGEITALYAETEKKRLLTEARVGDSRARDLIRAYTEGALKEARALRAKAAVGDSQTILAEEALRARLMTDPRYDVENYIEEAQTFLEAGVPARAALLADIASAKGGRVPMALTRAINAALDNTVPERAQAREIETAVNDNVIAFKVARAQALADSLGQDAEGNTGTGTSEQRATASMAAKVGAYRAAQGA